MRAGWARPGEKPGEDVCLCHPRQSLRLCIEGDLLIRAHQAHKALRHPSRVQMRQECVENLLIGLQVSALPNIICKAPIPNSGSGNAVCLSEPFCLLC